MASESIAHSAAIDSEPIRARRIIVKYCSMDVIYFSSSISNKKNCLYPETVPKRRQSSEESLGG